MDNPAARRPFPSPDVAPPAKQHRGLGHKHNSGHGAGDAQQHPPGRLLPQHQRPGQGQKSQSAPQQGIQLQQAAAC